MKKRDLTIDLMKGIAIFLVVLGHVIWITSGQDEFPLRKLIFSVHMPLFFFASGYLTPKLTNTSLIRTFLVKKCRLLLPLIVFGLLDIVLYDENWAQWEEFLRWEKFGLWFFFALFCFNVTYASCQYILRERNNKLLEIVILIIPVLISIALRKYQHTEIGNALNFMQAYNYAFFLMGIVIKHYGLEEIARRNDVGVILLAIYATGLYTGHPALNIPMKASGVLLIFSSLKTIVENGVATNTKMGGVIATMGQNTLCIYVLHYYLLRTLDKLPLNILEFVYSSPVYYLIIMSIVSSFLVFLSIVGGKFLCTNIYIRKYAFGK
ncbi:acyltransferase family protein [Bacteroides gallinaceum]|uniref:acyltransferase family protein n=1 Tax=Bacteroides gallinaceum TaxID=1462571 RepID=UPI0025AB4102|nr:acyltransferase family protein [Bacteroides gallinaceum]MDN0066647.1 acyltransferase family protein [Bacteroides gallinaceum]